MKKTFKKAFVLVAVITVMMICALVLPASAAEQTCVGNQHVKEYIIEKVVVPTCEEGGYTVDYCTVCNKETTLHYDETTKTGHNYIVTDYVERYGGSYYLRELTCQNEYCYRPSDEHKDGVKNSIYVDKYDKYFSVEFLNTFESPKLGDDIDGAHKDYFLASYYEESDPDTWVVVDSNDHIDRYYAPAAAENTKVLVGEDGTVHNPEYEYFKNSENEIELYVLEGSTAVYSGKTPVRFKDMEIGRYDFVDWVITENGAEVPVNEYKIKENTVFNAKFDAYEGVVVSYAFVNGRTQLTDQVYNIPYGHTVSYSIKTPEKASTVENSYVFIGWKVGNSEAIYKTYVPVYHEDAVIYAQYETIKNRYNIEFVDFAGRKFVDENEQPIVDMGIACSETAEHVSYFTSALLKRPDDPEYVYEATGNWEITKINGYNLLTKRAINLNRLELPAEMSAKDENGNVITINHKDYDMITVAPTYYSYKIPYTIKISIMHNRFEEEDLYDKDTPRSDILDDFNIIVYDSNGRYIADAETDKNGQATVKVNYSDTLRFTAVSDNGKYFGETTIFMATAYRDIEKNGVGIAPSLSDEWLANNTHSCGCICHSILSPIVLRIYNLIYNLFKIEIVCCDDLFAVHGNILAYKK